MKIEYVKYFIEVVKAGSITKASANIHIAQQTLSAAMSSLEHEYGLKLLERTNRGIQLTKHGHIFYQEFSKVLHHLEYLEEYATENLALTAQDIKGSINILCTPIFSQTVFYYFIKSFQEKYPKININLFEKSPSECLEKLQSVEEQDVDLIMMNVGEQLYHENILAKARKEMNAQIETLFKEEVVALVGKKSDFAKKNYLSKKDLQDKTVVFYKNEMGDENWIIPSLEESGFNLEKCIYTGSMVVYGRMLATENAISFFGKKHFTERFPYYTELDYVKLKDKINQYVVLTYKKDGNNEKKYVKDFLEIIRSYY